MISLILCRQVPDLLAKCTLLIGCFLLSGCFFAKWVNPEEYVQRPGLLIIANPGNVKAGMANYTVELDKIEISGVRLGDWLDQAKSWRINLFQGGTRVVGSDNFTTDRIIKLEKIPVDKLLRADLDLILSGTPEKEDAQVTTKSFTVLIHQYPEP